MSANRYWLRTTFDDAPELFDRTRPVCPPQLFDELTALAQLPAGARLLEIGCGTGQATLPLAERGYAVVALDIGPRLAEFTQRKLATFPNVEIINTAFEAWDAAGTRFDGVVAFNAFHWLDPDVRYAQAAQLLPAGGALVLVGTRFVLPDNAEPFWAEMQEDYAAIHGGPAPDPPPHPDAVGDLRGEIEASGSFRTVAVQRYLWNVRYTADEYISLLSTASWHRQLDAESRRDLFERLRQRIAAQPEGAINATLLATLHVAQRL
jgi:SAM-dependent methyltransferase